MGILHWISVHLSSLATAAPDQTLSLHLPEYISRKSEHGPDIFRDKDIARLGQAVLNTVKVCDAIDQTCDESQLGLCIVSYTLSKIFHSALLNLSHARFHLWTSEIISHFAWKRADILLNCFIGKSEHGILSIYPAHL